MVVHAQAMGQRATVRGLLMRGEWVIQKESPCTLVVQRLLFAPNKIIVNLKRCVVSITSYSYPPFLLFFRIFHSQALLLLSSLTDVKLKRLKISSSATSSH